MNRKILLIALLILAAFFIVQPRSMAIKTMPVTDFQNTYVTPAEDLTASFYEPLLGRSVTHAFKVSFPSLPLKSAKQIQAANIVKDSFGQPTSSLLLLTLNPTILKVQDWYDGAVTYNPETMALDMSENGFYYEGFFPSPNQLASLIAYQHGWELNYVESAKRLYEFNSSMTMPSYILEEPITHVSVNDSYNLGVISIYQQGAKIKGNDSIQTPKRTLPAMQVNMQIQETIDSINDTTKQFGLEIGLIVLFSLAIGALATVCVYNCLGIKYTKDDLATADRLGYNRGVNETNKQWQIRLLELLANRSIDNTTYSLLMSQMDSIWKKAMAAYTNPYQFGAPDSQSNDWVHSIISVLTQAVVWVIIITVIILVLWLIRKTGILSHSSGSSGSSSGQPIKNIFNSIFDYGMNTGAIAA